MKQETVLVVGASGLVGSEIVRLLKGANYRIRATTSKQVVAPSENLIHVDVTTGEGVKDAFQGVDRAFLLSPPGYADQYLTLSPLIQEAKRRGLKKVVLMTAMGANAVETSPFRRAELELEKSGLKYNIIRPNWFLQNFHTFWVQGIRQESKILLPAGKAKVSFIDARDISNVAFHLLTTDQLANQAFDLTGPEAVDHDQVAEVISNAIGKKVAYQEIAPETLKTSLLNAGLPGEYVDFLVTIMGFLREGYSAAVTTNVKKITGRQPRDLVAYANDYKQQWL